MLQIIGTRPFLHDLPEIDNLPNPEGPILEAQNQAAEVFGASKTWFLVGGTTCGIQAAIMGVCSPGDTLILPRNSHKSATSAMVLTGLVPKYIFPNYDFDWDIPTTVSPAEVKRAIEELESEGLKPGAVFITSPTYQGVCNNIKEISALCHLHNIPLIVDEAHGAHFGFHPSLPSSALQQGADVVIQSTHKVLFSLTQSSMLHVSDNSFIDKDKISKCLESLQTTSPSSLLLASLDATTSKLKENPTSIFDNTIKLAKEAKNTIQQIPGLSVFESTCIDPLRVTIGFNDLGLSGYEVDDFIYRDQKVISELPGSCFITFPFTPQTGREHIDRLILAFRHLSSSFTRHQVKKELKTGVDLEPWNVVNCMKLSPREAFFIRKRRVDIKDVVGKICGELICPFPPGIPIMTPGEVISDRVMHILLQSKANGAKIIGASDPLLSSLLICDI
ncbi:hypothetical protein BVRB_2g035840 [Beta vulgaris subsp. vulgaris]|nr:hypothetical protein BVRB_2g035840 [Beta vulgaris subsp. vulgaris]